LRGFGVEWPKEKEWDMVCNIASRKKTRPAAPQVSFQAKVQAIRMGSLDAVLFFCGTHVFM